MRARDQLELNKRTMGVLTDIARILNKQCAMFRSELTDNDVDIGLHMKTPWRKCVSV